MHPRFQKEWNRLETLRHRYEETLKEASPAQQQFTPESGGWNMLQLVRHLISTEEISTAYLLKKNYTNARREKGLGTRFRSMFLRLMLRLPLKFKAPPIAALQPANEQEVEQLLADWKTSREKLKGYLDNFPADKLNYEIYRHPRSGWISMEQALQFFGDHLQHHQQQLARLRKAPGFPA